MGFMLWQTQKMISSRFKISIIDNQINVLLKTTSYTQLPHKLLPETVPKCSCSSAIV